MGNHKIEWAGKRDGNTVTFIPIADYNHGTVCTTKVLKDFEYLLCHDLEAPRLILYSRTDIVEAEINGFFGNFDFATFLRKNLPKKTKIVVNDTVPEDADLGEWIT